MPEEIKGDFDTQITGSIDPNALTPDPADVNFLENLVNEVEAEQSKTTNEENKPDTTPASDATPDILPESVEGTDSEKLPVQTGTEDPAPVEAPAQDEVKSEAPVEDPLEKEFPTPKHLSPEKKSNWGQLRQRTATFEKKAKELEAKYEEAVSALASYEKGAALPEPIQKEIEELRNFRRMADIQSDPQFQKEFLGTIVSEEDKLFTKLQEQGASPEFIKAIVDNGGILSKSKDEWARILLGGLKGEENEFVREEVKQSLIKIFDTEERRKIAVRDAAINYEKHVAERSQQYQQQEQQSLQQMQEEVARIQREIPWANEPKKPVNATPDQMKAYERASKEWSVHVERFQKGLYSTDPKIRAQTAMAACGYFKLAEDIKSIQQENATLRQQIQRLQSVGRTSTQPIINAPKPVVKKNEPSFLMDDKDALEQMMKDMGI